MLTVRNAEMVRKVTFELFRCSGWGGLFRFSFFPFASLNVHCFPPFFHIGDEDLRRIIRGSHGVTLVNVDWADFRDVYLNPSTLPGMTAMIRGLERFFRTTELHSFARAGVVGKKKFSFFFSFFF